MPRRIATMATTTISSVMENPPCRLMRRNVPECDGRHAGVKSHRGGDPTDGRWRPTDGSHPDVRAGHGPLERWNARTHRATFQRTGRGDEESASDSDQGKPERPSGGIGSGGQYRRASRRDGGGRARAPSHPLERIVWARGVVVTSA